MKAQFSMFRTNQSRLGFLQKSLLAILSVAILFWAAPSNVRAADDSADAKKPAAAAQANDEGYTAKIKQFTNGSGIFHRACKSSARIGHGAHARENSGIHCRRGKSFDLHEGFVPLL